MFAVTVCTDVCGLIISSSCMQGSLGFVQLLFDLTVDFK